MKKFLYPGLIFVVILLFFWQVFLKGLLPIPADTIVGLYYPFRDIYSKTNPNGVPFKNFLITDPIRQQYPWKKIVVDLEKDWEMPLWNPYNSTGTPLLANSQSSPFYAFNFIFFILPFRVAWTIFIFLQPLLAGLFLFFYLKKLKLKDSASFFGAISFSLSGFVIAWLEWGTIIHTALWLPLILLSIDKIVLSIRHQVLNKNNKKTLLWSLIYFFSLTSSFFSGHLQTFFYVFIFSIAYFFVRWIQHKKNKNILLAYLILNTLFLILTSVQWLPTLKLIEISARNIDVVDYLTPGWFVPWQNMIQFIAPDFFGNPTTLNYWGIWNYGEFIGYTGIATLLMAFFALFFRKDKKTLFFGAAFFLSLIFAFPTFFAKIPFEIKIPLISTAQPTRLIFITSFCLSILGALGFDHFLKTKLKAKIIYAISFFSLVFVGLWLFVMKFYENIISLENINVAKQNLILPTIFFIAVSLILIFEIFVDRTTLKGSKMLKLTTYLIILILVFDLLRFGWKFTPFTKSEYLFPSTKITSFLQKQQGQFRVMSADKRILPPNFSIMYKIQTLDGYDPLYLRRYGELIAALERGEPNINPPFGFNRIINPLNYSSSLIDLMNVKYILSIDPITDSKFSEIFRDGSIKIYENKSVIDRAFFVEKTITSKSKQETINEIFNKELNFKKSAIVENVINDDLFNKNWSSGDMKFLKYSENKVTLRTKNIGDGFLVFTDAYYPNWRAKIDGKQTEIYLTNFNYRGIVVPSGEHEIEFYITMF
ncbi:MAG: YfhO family protein [Patescibacteria group bacterium]